MTHRQGGADARQGVTMAGGNWARLRIGLLAMLATILAGVGHPVTFPQAWAQTAPIPFDLIGDQTPVSLASQLPAHDPTVGVVAGSGGVSGGAASWEIPVAVPLGRRGMQPSVSLSYSSRAGNGIAGMGWSLSGLSSLHRCPMTLAQDGQIRAVLLDAGDRLCLDGQRLIATSGAYGAVGTSYGTEMESFARVTQLGGDLTSNVSYFKVERKSGEIAWYGNTGTATSPARVVPGGVSMPLSWLIARVEDRVGNAMHYSYTSVGDGETLADAIWYTGTVAAMGNRRVAFTYEDRPSSVGSNDRSSSYLAGGVTRQTKRLTAVTTFVDATPVRSLVLNYGSGVSASTGRSLLQSVSDCAHDGTNWICKPPTTFGWQHGAMSYALKAMPSGLSAPTIDEQDTVRPAGDFDGDGASEVVVVRRNSANATTQLWVVSYTPERQTRWTMPVPAEYAAPFFDQQGLQDFNQDGRIDLVGLEATATTNVKALVIRPWSGDPNATTYSAAFATAWNTGLLSDVLGTTNGHYSQIADMDGDGRSDIVMEQTPGNGSLGACEKKIRIYRNTPNPTTPQAQPTFPLLAEHCVEGVRWSIGTPTPEFENVRAYETIQKVGDFDGDGLPDLFIASPVRSSGSTGTEGGLLSRIVFGRRNAAGYALESQSFASLKQGAEPPEDTYRIAPGKSPLTLWVDINGDGLDDYLYSRYQNGAMRWTLRINRGGVLAAPLAFNSSAGLTGCWATGAPFGTCSPGPWYGGLIAPSDIDGDGRVELLVPTRFAVNRCMHLAPVPSQTCSINENAPECHDRYFCPENPVTAQPILQGMGVNAPFVWANGGTSLEQPDRVQPLHQMGYGDTYDGSVYYMSALRFVETTPGTIELREEQTDQLSGGVDSDLYGDGQGDRVTRVAGMFSDPQAYGIPALYADETPVPAALSPQSLPGGLSIYTTQQAISENLGPAALKNPDGITPQTQDMLAVVTDGFGQQTSWTYSPLSGEAGRSAGTTPLYTVPLLASQRYLDEQHIYFTSSMPVVAELRRSDGIGGMRSWRYGYGEAIYHTQGRGFQGFRTIIEEDVLAGLRTTTTFHQKFPLTSQPERVVVNPISRSGESGAISKEQYGWRCDRANRANAACTANLGVPTKYFPFLDTKESWSYDATTAAAGGTPAVLGYRQEVAASDTSCSGTLANASGYDVNGNLTARTVVQQDLGTGTAGTANRLQRQCVSEHSSYVIDTANWWLDKLGTSTVSTVVAWDGAQHALPAGTTNPTRTVSSSYVWNADRTLSSETVQSGVANQQRVTTYTYPATNNHGLPTGVAVSASGDANGTRSTGTTYTADGYFPLAVVNALNHSASTAVRARDGQPTVVTDANGLRTLIDYDAFGFATRKRFRGASDAVVVAPDQSVSVNGCVQLAYCWRPVEQYQIATVQDGSPTRLQRLDAQGRVWLQAELQQDGVWTHTMMEYTARGQLAWQTEPFRGGDAIVSTAYLYNDLLGRMTQKVVPKQGEDGRGDMVTTYGYSGRTATIQVCGSADAGTANCLNLSRTTDSLGRYVETRDALNGRTRFWYEANGNVAAIEDAAGTVTKASYNAIGQRTGVIDPNQGSWGFAYNALGEVTTQTDARGIATAFGYDKLGRPVWRTANIDVTGDSVADTVNDSWTYDPANAKGAPAASSRLINGTTERWTGTTYDALARPVQTDVTQALSSGTQSYRTRTKYDSYYGRPVGQEFPNGEAVQVLYSMYGHGLAEKDPGTGIEYRRTTGVNARGQTTSEAFGNGVVLNAGYQLQTGQLTGLSYDTAAGPVRSLGYGYDVFGNVTRQSLNGGASREDYSYDPLHRLVSSVRSGQALGAPLPGPEPSPDPGEPDPGPGPSPDPGPGDPVPGPEPTPSVYGPGVGTVTMSGSPTFVGYKIGAGTVVYGYDAVGNLTVKTDFSFEAPGSYSYTGGSCGGGANAVKSVLLRGGGSRTYCYDANGNLTGDNAGLSLKYDHQNLPTVAQRGALRDDFRYGPDGMRTRSWGSDGARVYLPGYEHRTDTGETKVYIGDYAVISKTGATRKVEYLLKDRLGSVDAVANASGSVIETRGYDAYGKPRNGTWSDLTPAKIQSTAVTPKGFTQHEHLNQLELIHMNGRAFDYNLGRFTGVDPFIQFPLNSQSLNPYTYILNNPLSGTDPTGYYGKFDSACDRPSMLGACDTSAGGGNTTRKVTAGKANQPGNGASTGSTVTPTNRNQSNAQSIAARFGVATLRGVLPAVDAYGHRGEPGALEDHAYNGLAAYVNGAIDGLFFVPGLQRVSMGLPRMEYEAKGLKTGAVVQAGMFFVGGGRTVAGRAGGLADDAARVAGNLADEAAPIIETIVVNVRGAATGSGARDAAATLSTKTQPNRIYSARELLRRAEEPGPFHNFPESFNKQVFDTGNRTVTPDFFSKARKGLSNDSIQYRLPGTINGRNGMYEIFTRPSTSGNTEIIMHRFFKPN